jgi:hypothetical protein
MGVLFTVLIFELSEGETLPRVVVNSFSTWVCQVYQPAAVPPNDNLGFRRGSFTGLLGVNGLGQIRFA